MCTRFKPLLLLSLPCLLLSFPFFFFFIKSIFHGLKWTFLTPKIKIPLIITKMPILFIFSPSIFLPPPPLLKSKEQTFFHNLFLTRFILEAFGRLNEKLIIIEAHRRMIVAVWCILVHQTLIWFSPINCSHQHTDHNDIYINSVHVHLCTSPADICLIYVHSYTHICPQWKKIAFDGRQVHCTLDLVSISVNISCIADL